MNVTRIEKESEDGKRQFLESKIRPVAQISPVGSFDPLGQSCWGWHPRLCQNPVIDFKFSTISQL